MRLVVRWSEHSVYKAQKYSQRLTIKYLSQIWIYTKQRLLRHLAYINSPECVLVYVNAAQTFQRLIDKVLRVLAFAFAYIDDVLVSKTTEEH